MSDLSDRSLRVAIMGIVPDDDPTIIADMQDRIDALEAALQRIVESSPPDTAYSWCQMRLALCNEIARDALSAEHQPQQQQ